MTNQTDYMSAAPQYRFADTLEEQEAQLRSNLLLQNFAVAREQHADDPVRPLYHYCNPDSGLSDPNGLCFWQDTGTFFTKPYLRETPGPTGDILSAMILSAGVICRMLSTLILRRAVGPGQHWSRKGGCWHLLRAGPATPTIQP